MDIWKRVAGLGFISVLAGCAMPNGYYQPATLSDGVISNPQVGWNGYSVTVPEGLEVFDPATANPDDPDLTQRQQGCLKDDDRYSRSILITYTESLLLEDPDGEDYILFASDTLEIGSPWSAWLSPDKEYFLRKMVNEKRVRINDTKAHNELLTINGHRGCYISGVARPYFTKKPESLAYEGYLILGNLKEIFWIEGFSPLEQRGSLQQKTREMVESLEIK